MYKYHKRTKLFADPTASSQIGRRFKTLVLRVILSAEPFLCFYAVCGLLSAMAYFLVPEGIYRMAVFISMAVLAVVFASVFLLCRHICERRSEECRYIECLVFLFCKYKSFRPALREMQTLFTGKEMRRVLNQAQFLLDRGAEARAAMDVVEKRLAGRRTALLHRYIQECSDIGRYSPPAEIITGLLTEGSEEKRPQRLVRFDRMRLAFCGAVSFGICFALRCFAEEHGLSNADIPAGFLMALTLISMAVIDFVFELWSFEAARDERARDTGSLFYDWLRELTFFLLVKPVPEAISVSAVYADKRIRRKVSKLASQTERDGVSCDAFVKMAEDCGDEKASRIMEFLYAKSEESCIAPSELFPMIRIMDERESVYRAGRELESKRRKQGILLSPQAASLVMVAGNLITLFTNIGREL